MKLYSITTSERDSRAVKKGGNHHLTIELYRGNRKTHTIVYGTTWDDPTLFKINEHGKPTRVYDGEDI